MLDFQSRQLQRRQLFVLQHEHGLEQRVVPERPLGLQFFHQLLKWHVLIRIAAERSLSYAAQQFAPSGIAGQTCAQRERVDEQPNQVLGLWQRASGDWRPNNDVFFAGVAIEQKLISS